MHMYIFNFTKFKGILRSLRWPIANWNPSVVVGNKHFLIAGPILFKSGMKHLWGKGNLVTTGSHTPSKLTWVRLRGGVLMVWGSDLCSLSVCLFVCLSLSLCLCLSISIFLSICLYACPSLCFSVSVCLSLSLCACLYVSVSACLPVFLPLSLSISSCLSVSVCVCLSSQKSEYHTITLQALT